MAVRKQVASRRRQEILQDLLLAGDVSVNELAEQLGVSATTVRRSLRALEEQGLLRRRHGGAVPIESSLYEHFRYDADFQERDQLYADEKRRIGLAASEHVKDGDIVALSAGTTTTQIARALKLHKDVTIVTNALNIAMEFARSTTLRVLLTGGYVSGGWFSVLGPTSLETIADTEIDITFVGVDGIEPKSGLTANHPDEADVNAAMIRQARRKVVVADHSKLGRTADAFVCPLHAVDLIITDTGATDEALAPFRSKKISIQQA
ncbi:GntR family transcriptional regulator [Capsulimonas corticalis]|uniref:GntR family transcriptional regulator n=1 Tax=Capsulimonas corticalis TaxID=2219043 RepID=A0A402CQC7_9BACT|nr:DeoR/GlpR family DNA-binding transcription regulator [Capsulimonas corticalis]BDI32796.1 GntR family transcriptional regulator [Capsulimonas corticalis]